MIPTVAYFVFLGAAVLGSDGPVPQVFKINKPFPTKDECVAKMLETFLLVNLPEGTQVLSAMCGRVNSAKEISI